jgi:acyl-CoA synthetase (AMP-forming)/AMP-acid ligase II
MLGSNGTFHTSADSCWGQGSPSTSSSDCSSVQDAFEQARRAATQDDTASPGDTDWENPWHSLLYERLRDRALPALISEGTITPAASLWTGSRLWLESFREADLRPGDRLLISLSPSAAFVQVMAAALWHGLSIALLPPNEDVTEYAEALDARAAVSDNGLRYGVPDPDTCPPHTWQPEGLAGPADPPETLRDTTQPPTPDVRFLLRTSGTTGTPTWIALSDRNVLSVLASHMPHLDLKNARTLSVLPWFHAFGLILDFLPALLSEAEIIRDPNGGRDPEDLLQLTRAWGATHLSAVPLVIDRLRQTGGGPEMLCSLSGGIVGGAPVSGSLAQLLSGTSLRAGYGQTEASPGIALGPTGHWTANYLGQPLGCDIHIDDAGELHFQGDNACIGIWRNGQLDRLDPNRLVATGDRVEQDGKDLFFRGRTDNTFKLSNGRLVPAGHVESRLKQRFQSLDEAFIFTPDGDNVALALRLTEGNSKPPSEKAIRATLGDLQERLVDVYVVDADTWVSTPKGTVAREEMTDVMRRTFSNASSSASSSSVSSSS